MSQRYCRNSIVSAHQRNIVACAQPATARTPSGRNRLDTSFRQTGMIEAEILTQFQPVSPAAIPPSEPAAAPSAQPPDQSSLARLNLARFHFAFSSIGAKHDS